MVSLGGCGAPTEPTSTVYREALRYASIAGEGSLDLKKTGLISDDVSAGDLILSLRSDGFYLISQGNSSSDQAIKCTGTAIVPNQELTIARRGSFFRGDRFDYYVRIQVETNCKLSAATVYVSNMPWM
jgi:hypothetical protein